MKKKPKLNSLPKSINTIDDVWEFFNYLYNVEGVIFHPVANFKEYKNIETDKPFYTNKEAKERNVLKDKCLEVCLENDFDIFKVAVEVIKKNPYRDKKTSSKKTQSNVAVCTFSADFVDNGTSVVISFSKNKSYKILYDHPLLVDIDYPGDGLYSTFNRLEFEQYFRYAEEGEMSSEIEVIKKNPHRDKRTSSKKTQYNVAVCILSEEYVEDDTGLVFEFAINKYYKILYDHPLWVNIEHPDVDSPLTFQRWEFEEHFRYAEEGEISSDML